MFLLFVNYCFGQSVSVKNVLYSFMLSFSDSTFNEENLESIVIDIDEWKLLGFLIGDRNSQDDFKMFCAEHKHVGPVTHIMLREWRKMHPYASWTLLYQALIKMNEKVMSKRILKSYLSGSCKILYTLCVHGICNEQ